MPVTCHISVSLDGFVAGPNQSLENPIGEGGSRLHTWMFESTAEPDAEVLAEVVQGIGAYVMGRNMFGGGAASALERARAAAGDRDVAIAGGASTVRQYLAAGLLDELYLHIVPIVLGTGERLLEGVGDPTLEPVKVVASPGVTHVKYHVVRPV